MDLIIWQYHSSSSSNLRSVKENGVWIWVSNNCVYFSGCCRLVFAYITGIIGTEEAFYK